MRKSLLQSMLFTVTLCFSALAWSSPATVDMQSGYNVSTYGAVSAIGESPPGVIAIGSIADYITLTSSSTAVAGSTASALASSTAVAGSTASAIASAGNTDNCSGCHGNTSAPIGSGTDALAIGPGMSYNRLTAFDPPRVAIVTHYKTAPMIASAAPMLRSMYPQRE